MSRNRDSIVGSQGAWLTVKRRIRLVAYGARLESVLGESPRGFESPILRRVISRNIFHIRLSSERSRQRPAGLSWSGQ